MLTLLHLYRNIFVANSCDLTTLIASKYMASIQYFAST